MNFLKRDGVSNTFSWMNCGDGLVSSDEIVLLLSSPHSTSQTASKRGKLVFDLSEIESIIDIETLL